MAVSLLELPPEIILLILSHLSTPGCRAAVAQTCRSLHNVTEEILYADVELWSEQKYDIYFRAVMVQKRRLEYTRHYAFRYSTLSAPTQATQALRISAYMPKLESLVLKLPLADLERSYVDMSTAVAMVSDVQCLFQDQADAVRGSFIVPRMRKLRGPIPFLKSCELDFGHVNRNQELLYLSAIDAVFKHPVLSHLSIKNVDFDFGNNPPREGWLTKPNSIQSLEFIACEIICTTLAQLLEIHVALKRLSLITTRCLWDGWSDDDPNLTIAKARWVDVVRAISLAKRAHALEHLELTSYNKHTVIPELEKPLNMSEFTELRSLRLDAATIMTPQLFAKDNMRSETICNDLGGEVLVTSYRRMTGAGTSHKNLNGNT